MKKITVAVIGGTLFIAGYYQARRQTEYMTSKSQMVSPASLAKPMTLSLKTQSPFAFRLDRSFVSSN
ncbi:hypothetical protein GO755_07530 [Spirosoma sp. HMF4905]|uniref:Uncharacterized protein n=1 Tax=Spirosoma arboris TaxID=2682092 RepID=A0A7K1S8B8_9BACT|nr:hypothetical protein [Spirosoma arboris]MVM29878.1 hypothetical protein [Spirosoma arboris]